jgi:hypothetical protein
MKIGDCILKHMNFVLDALDYLIAFGPQFYVSASSKGHEIGENMWRKQLLLSYRCNIYSHLLE